MVSGGKLLSHFIGHTNKPKGAHDKNRWELNRPVKVTRDNSGGVTYMRQVMAAIVHEKHGNPPSSSCPLTDNTD